MLGSRSCWRAWIDLLAGMLFFFSLEGAVVFFLVPRYLLFSGFLLFFRYLITKMSVILSMST